MSESGVPGAASPAGARLSVGSLVVPTAAFTLYLAHAAAAAILLIVGHRVFSLTAGFTTQAASAFVAVVAFACAAGAVFAGRRARWASSPMALLALLMAGLGLASALSAGLYGVVRAGYLVLWPVLGGSEAGLFLMRFILALALVALPAALFCASPPVLARLIATRPEGAGLSLGFAFGLALAGSALGLAVAGSFVLPGLGIHGSLLLGLSLSGIAAAGTVLLRQKGLEGQGSIGAALAGDAVRAGEPRLEEHPAATTTGTAAALGAMMTLFAFTAWGFLLLWDRGLSFVLGRTLVARTTTGAVFLLTLALGVFLAAALTDLLAAPFTALAATLTASAVAAYASMYVMPQVSLLYLKLSPYLGRSGLSQIPAAAATAALLLPATVLLGASLPLLAQAARQRRRSAVGVLVFIAIGVIAADLGVGLMAIPLFGLRRALSLVAAVGIMPAILALMLAPFRRPALRTTFVLALLGLMVILGGFAAAWDPRIVASGLYRYGTRALTRFGSVEEYLAARQSINVLFYREGVNSSVMVEETLLPTPGLPPVEALSLTVDGKVEATTGDDTRTQVLQGHIPILVHGPTESVLLIDFLNGVTAGSILRHPVKTLTVIEREPALFEASRFFASYNNSPHADQRLVRLADSARSRLLADPAAYDVIIVPGMEPWLPASAALVTREGIDLLKSRLNQGGLLALRVPLASTGEAALRAVMRTFAGAFDSVLVFQISQEDLLLLGSAEPLGLDVGWFRNVISSTGDVSRDLRRIMVLGPNEILYTFRLAGEELRGVLGDGPGNDDDRAPVEFASVRELTIHSNSALMAAVDSAGTSIVPQLRNYGVSPEEKAEFLYNLAKSYLGIAGDPARARDIARELSSLGQTAKARWVTGECLMQQSDLDGALGEWNGVLDLDPGNLDALFSLGTVYMDSRDYWKSEPFLEEAARLHPDISIVRYNHGRILYYLGKNDAAIGELKEARRIAVDKEKGDGYPLVDYLVGIAAHRMKKDKQAADSLETYLKWAYTQPLTRVEVDAHLKLAEAYEGIGKRFEALKERQKGDDLLRRLQGQTPQNPTPSGAAPSGPATAPTPAGVPGTPAAAPG
jgi:spermidine synthase